MKIIKNKHTFGFEIPLYVQDMLNIILLKVLKNTIREVDSSFCTHSVYKNELA